MDTREWDYRVVELVRPVDGDTYDLRLHKRMDFGFRLIEDKTWASRFRLLGIDTPEMNETGGAEAKLFATNWIIAAILEDVLRGQTFKTDNFGRWLIDLYRLDDGLHLSDLLRAEGLVRVRPA